MDRDMIEHYGPPDLRVPHPADIADARSQVVDLLRAVRTDDGYRASVTAAIAAIYGAVDAIIELGQDQVAFSILQMQAARLAQRIEASGVSEPVRTLQ